jgi:hypothetical protein
MSAQGRVWGLERNDRDLTVKAGPYALPARVPTSLVAAEQYTNGARIDSRPTRWSECTWLRKQANGALNSGCCLK